MRKKEYVKEKVTGVNYERRASFKTLKRERLEKR